MGAGHAKLERLLEETAIEQLGSSCLDGVAAVEAGAAASGGGGGGAADSSAVPRRIVHVAAHQSVGDALELMAAARVHSVPVSGTVFDTDVCIVDHLDLARHLAGVRAVPVPLPDGSVADPTAVPAADAHSPPVELAKENVMAVDEFYSAPIRHVLDISRTITSISLPASMNLLDAIKRLVATRAHRIYTLNDNLQVSNIVSQRSILRFLHDHVELFEKLERGRAVLFQKPIHVEAKEVAQQHSRVMYVSPTTTALEVFTLMQKTKRRFLPIINSSKHLVGCVSASDFLKLERSQYYLLYSPILTYLEKLERARSPVAIPPSASISAVIKKMHEHNVHHLCVMKDESGDSQFSNVCGIVDVLQAIVCVVLVDDQ